LKKPTTVAALDQFGRTRLSPNFFMRDFLFSDIASIHGLNNVPDDPDLAIAAGSRLCIELLEPLQSTFGRVVIRSAFRSIEVNGLGNAMQRDGKTGYNCASNEANYAGHIWDKRDQNGNMGATACIVLPAFADTFSTLGDWTKLAWWIHDHLPYSTLFFFPKMLSFNLTWNESPEKRIDSYVEPKGCLTRPGMPNHSGTHEKEWRDLRDHFNI
jgi:hypothetical protein